MRCSINLVQNMQQLYLLGLEMFWQQLQACRSTCSMTQPDVVAATTGRQPWPDLLGPCAAQHLPYTPQKYMPSSSSYYTSSNSIHAYALVLAAGSCNWWHHESLPTASMSCMHATTQLCVEEQQQGRCTQCRADKQCQQARIPCCHRPGSQAHWEAQCVSKPPPASVI